MDDTPNSISEAYAFPDANYWKKAVRSETNSIHANRTWKITDCSYGCKLVGCNWVFIKNLKPYSTIEKYKTWILTKGYTQKDCEDFIGPAH
jgi:hypothetical protein